MTTNILDTLAELDLFADLSKKEIKSVRQRMTPMSVTAGTELITEGEIGREAFIITDGEATIWRRGRLVTTVGPGTVLGEMAVLTGITRTATVRAETDLELQMLSRREFFGLLDESPTMTRKLLVSTINRLQELEPGLLQ
ncbi:cyclic nucleotide-binding domain-containing protein [Ilumatobacter coccineus]|jgi:CRP/FNR family transcriptional regulator, cyclic AMP receptor protein|uniref:Putative transcriptional regulator n=1 Tax=Ilumatobacter coccineus (strain NBRC 103263 / KCTC 29153 / YM16-304) TaxID=1313172 RepID=A0A6C7EFK4_ILUCY|nr:cyclic nucleotide-binding domain-containing protein [Ilumatobacter coccineus]BAN03949.1 putative transcriptional regulator [Ilumatobacter coccineus YM16-304]